MKLARSYSIWKALDIDCKKSPHRLCTMTDQIPGPSQHSLPDDKRHIKDQLPIEATMSSTMSVLDQSTIRRPANSWTLHSRR
jgi:hypothetical protein